MRTIEEIQESWEKEKIIPTKDEFIENKTLLYYEEIVTPALYKDPTIIVLLKGALLKQKYCDIVLERKLEITEEILKQNPTLTKYSNIMEEAISKNPKTIKYLHCNITSSIINKALQKYTLTKEDIIKNPYLKEQEYITSQIPELHYYSSYPLKIIELKEAIAYSPISIKQLEIFKDKESYINKITYLISILKTNKTTFDQNKIYKKLMTVIEKIAEGRYKIAKHNFEYTDIISINYKMINTFEETIQTGNTTKINILIEHIYNFTNKKMNYLQIQKSVLDYYKKYIQSKSLNIETTKEFCNQVLNYHRDFFISKEQERIINHMKQILPLTNKKIDQIYKSRKINKLTELIKNKQLNTIDIKEYLIKVRQDIESNKIINKKRINITPDMFLELEKTFLNNGTLNYDQVKKIINCNDKKIIKYIINKYEKIKLKFLKKTFIDDRSISEEEKQKLSFNINNFVMNNKEKSDFALAMLMYNITEQETDEILKNEEYIEIFKKILPFCNMVDELTMETMKNIFIQYPKILTSLEKEHQKNSSIYKNIDKIIAFAQGLNKTDYICIQALGKEIVEKVGENYSNDYLEIYIKMLRKEYSNIPSVNFEYEGITLQSGDYFNPERLLIGKYPSGSCIDLNNVAGEKTYKECLLKPEADVILLKKENTIFDRILVFRRGNVIQLVTQNNHEYSLEMYQKIANQMIEQIENDNIDYIVVNQNSMKEKDTEIITDGRFTTYFPHADTTEKVKPLYKTNKKLQFSIKPLKKYYKKRKKISYHPTTDEIKRIQALNAFIKKEKNLPNIAGEKYICGEDWMIIKKESEIEEIILNKNDLNAQIEIEEAKQILENDRQK